MLVACMDEVLVLEMRPSSELKILLCSGEVVRANEELARNELRMLLCSGVVGRATDELASNELRILPCSGESIERALRELITFAVAEDKALEGLRLAETSRDAVDVSIKELFRPVCSPVIEERIIDAIPRTLSDCSGENVEVFSNEFGTPDFSGTLEERADDERFSMEPDALDCWQN
jgi:hypothetical protein